MYLRALEIQGFKSFPDKTVLNFGEDITAIVGPNGSGKSNISDAIRWVMGEQSTRTLRGGKMEDVIFGGTAQRKQTGYAEVSLVLDNTTHLFDLEESEVMVTRRYYRSGESEYYINRRSVRLKDINELFMDTGLGREGYSIIGQGRIDEILSQKSSDRREVFEEAAGISRYRHRKEEAERKLERTDENLVRINDKIAELELQVEPLREQSERAKKFLVLRDELRGLEISVWLDTLERIRVNNIKLETDYKEAVRQKEEAEQVKAQVTAMAQELEELEVKEGELTEEIKAVKASCNGHILKVIVEACQLTREEKIAACRVVSMSGADFIKTSTGFASGGATVEDVALFREHISPDVRIKAAGGIRTFEQAQAMLEAGADRIGASALVALYRQEG